MGGCCLKTAIINGNAAIQLTEKNVMAEVFWRKDPKDIKKVYVNGNLICSISIRRLGASARTSPSVFASSGRASPIRIDRTGQTESIHQPSATAASAAAPEYE